MVQGPAFLGISVKHRQLKTSITAYASKTGQSHVCVHVFTLVQSCALSYVHLPVLVSCFLGSEASSGLRSPWEVCSLQQDPATEKQDPQDLPRPTCWVVPSAVPELVCRAYLTIWRLMLAAVLATYA